MRRLIDANKLKKYIDDQKGRPFTGVTIGEAFKIMVDEQPAIERKTGTWVEGKDMPPMKHRNGKPKKFWPSLRYCSVCGHEAYDDSDWGEQLFDWCPYCGAYMKLKTGN